MFKPIDKIASLTDMHMYFLSEELKLSRLIGTGFDYSRINKEDKITIKKAAYDYFAEKNVLKTDFFGVATINTEYADFVRLFENPEYYACCMVVDYDKNQSQKRKILFSSNKWIGLEYYSENAFVAGALNDTKDATEYFLGDLNAPVDLEELSQDALNTIYKFSNLNAVVAKMAFVDEYKKVGEHYVQNQKMYVKLKNNTWATLKSDDGENVQIVPMDVLEISINAEV